MLNSADPKPTDRALSEWLPADCGSELFAISRAAGPRRLADVDRLIIDKQIARLTRSAL